MKNYKEMIGRVMRQQRELHKLSTQGMADRMGVDKSCIARWETGKRNISVESLIDYLNAINMDLYEFMDLVKEVDEGKTII